MHDTPHAFYEGFCRPQNVVLWDQELLDARYAGLSLVLANVYGPATTEGSVDPLRKALGADNRPTLRMH